MGLSNYLLFLSKVNMVTLREHQLVTVRQCQTHRHAHCEGSTVWSLQLKLSFT